MLTFFTCLSDSCCKSNIPTRGCQARRQFLYKSLSKQWPREMIQAESSCSILPIAFTIEFHKQNKHIQNVTEISFYCFVAFSEQVSTK